MSDPSSALDEDVPDLGARNGIQRGTYLLWIGGVALVVLSVALHLTGLVGPGGH